MVLSKRQIPLIKVTTRPLVKTLPTKKTLNKTLLCTKKALKAQFGETLPMEYQLLLKLSTIILEIRLEKIPSFLGNDCKDNDSDNNILFKILS